MQVTTVNTLTFTIRAHNGKQQLAEDIIAAGAESVGVTVGERKSLPLPEGENPAARNTQIQVHSDDLDKLTMFWDRVSDALHLVGVDAVSP